MKKLQDYQKYQQPFSIHNLTIFCGYELSNLDGAKFSIFFRLGEDR
jgi:hypothetical protein